MKRIVQCPKCESKLAVFDLGKPINQKCPKCGNAFIVDTEQNKTGSTAPAAMPAETSTIAATPTASSPVVVTTTPASKDVSAHPQATSDAEPAKMSLPTVPEATAPVPVIPAPAVTSQLSSAPELKEVSLKKPVSKPAAPKPATPELSTAQEPIAHHSGISFLHVMVIIGLLILTIILQVMGKKAAEKHYADLATRLSRIEVKMQSIK